MGSIRKGGIMLLVDDIKSQIYRNCEAKVGICGETVTIYETCYGYKAEVPNEFHDVIYFESDCLNDLLDEIFEDLRWGSNDCY